MSSERRFLLERLDQQQKFVAAIQESWETISSRRDELDALAKDLSKILTKGKKEVSQTMSRLDKCDEL